MLNIAELRILPHLSIPKPSLDSYRGYQFSTNRIEDRHRLHQEWYGSAAMIRIYVRHDKAFRCLVGVDAGGIIADMVRA